MTPFLPYGKQSISSDDIDRVSHLLTTDMITRGPKTEEFENKIKDSVGAKYTVCFNSGSTALAAAYYAADISAYDQVITSANTFIATVASPIQKGASIYLPDIDPKLGILDFSRLEAVYLNIAEKSRGKTFIVPVHFAGVTYPMEKVAALAKPKTVIIEDAAHALGSHYSDGSTVGSCRYSDMTIFSFHPLKSITTGEGGCVTTNNQAYYEKLLLYRNNGIVASQAQERPWDYRVVDATGNYHMTSFQAALGCSQFERIDLFRKKRQELVEQYKKHLANLEIVEPMLSNEGDETFYHLMAVSIDFDHTSITKEKLVQKLHQQGIVTQVHYVPLYLHPVLEPVLTYVEREGMDLYYQRELSLPLYVEMSIDDVKYVCNKLAEALR